MDEFDEQLNEEIEEDNYSPASIAPRRRKEWTHAQRHYRIARSEIGYSKLKPLHFYAKNAPEAYYQRTNKTNNKGKHRNAYGNYNPAKNWSVSDKRKIQTGENQIKELFDNE